MPPSAALNPADAQAGHTDTRVRVMIVDDSITARTMLARIVEGDDRLRVVSLASGAQDALKQLETIAVDVVLLDLEMPGMGGLEALPELIEKSGGANIMVVSSIAIDGAEPTLKALALGAADTVAKPTSGVFDRDYRMRLAERIEALSTKRSRGTVAAAPPKPRPVAPAKPIVPEVLAIGASTGGIHALDILLGGLPARIGVPILITQHLPDHFIDVFARQIERSANRPARIAEDGLLLQPDEVVIAPGDAHICVRGEPGAAKIKLNRDPMPSGCRPSVDPMFASLAKVYGKGTLGVVLSGMGTDGSRAAADVDAAGGQVWVQDSQTSAVWGMPRAVVNAGLASAILTPAELAERIAASVEAMPCR